MPWGTPIEQPMTAWIRQNHAKLQFGLRMTFAALLTYAIGEALELSQIYWAVLSAVVVIQGSAGGSLKTGIDRLVGTVGGAVWGAIIAVLIPHTSHAALGAALLLAIAPLAVVTGYKPSYRVAPITAIIVLMGGSLLQTDPVTSAISRVFEISLGSAIAILVAFFILPARAHRLLARSASATVSAMAELTGMLAAHPCSAANAGQFLPALNRIRTLIAQSETRAEEAKVERANHLSGAPDPEPLARTLRRLRHDLAMMVRALSLPLAKPARDRVEQPLEALFGALGLWLNAAAKALREGTRAPSLDAFHAAIEAYKAAIAGGGQEALRYEAGSNDTERVFALLFLFEQMQQNLEDLAARTNELGGQEAVTGAAALTQPASSGG
jgi:uncharacterized membrane protein YccC